MKKSLKGIVLASLISTQVLTAPISAFAVTAETTENSEQVAPQDTEEKTDGEVVAPNLSEENKEEPNAVETPNQGDTADVTVEEDPEILTPEVTPEIPEIPKEENPVVTASEEKMQAVRGAVANANAILDAGTYMAETTIPLRAAMAAATTLLNQTDVTDDQLNAAIADINEKIAGLIKAEVELSFARNLVMAIDEATKIINNTDEFKDIYTQASVATKKAGIQTAVDAGKLVLAKFINAEGMIDQELAVANRVEIVATADAIIAAINNGNGLVRTDHLVEILTEAMQLKGAKVASDKDKADFEAALKQAAIAIENALTDAEADAAVSALRAAMDNLRLVVVVSVVDEAGNLIMDQAATSLNGLYKTAWNVEPPVVEGYEYVSANNQPVTFTQATGQAMSGTFGDGTNDVTLVYKQTKLEQPILPKRPINPDPITNKPEVVGLTNNIVTNNQKNTYYSKKKLPQTGEQTSSMTSFGLMAVAVGALAFFKKRKIKE